MIQTKLKSNSLYNAKDIQRIKELPARSGYPVRDDFERDYSRIVHSAAFRRLQSKTQVIGVGEGDFHRTRLTHSMEVAQIARGIVLSLNLKSNHLNKEHKQIDTSLIEAAALAHDFGHPPFGHQGERALNEMMYKKAKSGFEGNAQTLRILTRLERGVGLNLTRATLLAILKYPIKFDEAVEESRYKDLSQFSPPKSNIYPEDSEIFNWLLLPFNDKEKDFYLTLEAKHAKEHKQTSYKTFECSIIELADDIAYATHDLEDAMRLDFIKVEEVIELLENNNQINGVPAVIEKFKKKVKGHLSEQIKDATADLISIFISSVEIKVRDEIKHPRLKYYAYHDKEIRKLIKSFKNLVYANVIRLPRVQTIEWKGGHIIREMFNAFFDETKLLPLEDQELIKNGYDKARVVCDYIAGMTDSYALKMFSRLYEARESRLFDI